MLTINGKASRRFPPTIGKITKVGHPFYARSNSILITQKLDFHALGYLGCITKGPQGSFYHPDHIYETTHLEELQEGDIVSMTEDGLVYVLWAVNSHQNVLFLTESCNCRCLMCPQPPREHDPMLYHQALQVLNLLRGNHIEHICITGGEPTLLGDKFFDILGRCVREHPNARVDVLTNGKAFADTSFAQETRKIVSRNVLFCVSLHAEVDTIHDELVGVKGSWAATQQGIYNLASCGSQIEIRHVITRRNFFRLPSFAEHMYNYFPFCAHYALMGLELHGSAAKNKALVDISPNEYKQELRAAVMTMHRRNLPVSVYNIPLCMCDPDVMPFARKSISTWKNMYPSQCGTCARKMDCAGFFATSTSLPLDHIQPLKEDI